MKIIDNKVLLTLEEYEHLKAKSTRIPIDKDGNFIEYAVYDTDRVLSKPEYRDYIYNKAHKETEEKIKEIFNELYIYFTANCMLGIPNPYKSDKYAGLIKRYAKQHGVEVK